MPQDKTDRRLLVLVIAIISVVAIVSLGDEFFDHVYRLVSYLAHNPSTQIANADPELKSYLSRWSSDPSFAIHLVSGPKFSLAKSDVGSTIQRLGTISLSESTEYKEKEDLPKEVRSYIEMRLKMLETDNNLEERDDYWMKILLTIKSWLGRRRNDDEIRQHREIKNVNKKLLKKQLQEAKSALTTAGVADFSGNKFLVGSIPDKDSWVYPNWPVSSRGRIGQNEQKFELFSVAGDCSYGEVSAWLNKIFYNVQFDRPWFPERLIDDGTALPQNVINRYFGPHGTLRIVPQEMVIYLGMEVVFQFEGEPPVEFRNAIQNKSCCELKSKRLSVRLWPSTIKEIEEGLYQGKTEPNDPKFVALISKRRKPRSSAVENGISSLLKGLIMSLK